jgi:hypothetical protein
MDLTFNTIYGNFLYFCKIGKTEIEHKLRNND